MRSQYHKHINAFLLALALVVAGMIHVDPVALGQTAPQDDVQSTAVPGQIAPRLQELGNHKFPVTTKE